MPAFGCQRTLYSDAYLGINGYLQKRQTLIKFNNSNERTSLRQRLHEYITQDDSRGAATEVHSDDIQHFVYLLNNDAQDLHLLETLLRKSHKQQITTTTTTTTTNGKSEYVIGPVVLRALNHLGADETALMVCVPLR